VFQKILLAYNGSAEGRCALLACTEIAAFSNSEMHLLAVAIHPTNMYVADGMVLNIAFDDEKDRMRDILAEGVEEFRRRGFTAHGHLSMGEPVDEICRVATELQADLIVVGHGRPASFASRWWKGSIGKTLIDHAPCSVYIALTANEIPAGARRARVADAVV
jgi:nucleotide-binding universal stress UspA family protein